MKTYSLKLVSLVAIILFSLAQLANGTEASITSRIESSPQNQVLEFGTNLSITFDIGKVTISPVVVTTLQLDLIFTGRHAAAHGSIRDENGWFNDATGTCSLNESGKTAFCDIRFANLWLNLRFDRSLSGSLEFCITTTGECQLTVRVSEKNESALTSGSTESGIVYGAVLTEHSHRQ